MKTRHIIPLLASAALSAGILFPHAASASTHTDVLIYTSVPVTFRLHVSGAPTRGTTFWVAWGPSAGSFGIIRLRRSSNGLFTGNHRFPATARVYLSYIEGHGTISTRFGPAPGNPVRTIRSLAPAPAVQLSQAVVQYQSPVG